MHGERAAYRDARSRSMRRIEVRQIHGERAADGHLRDKDARQSAADIRQSACQLSAMGIEARHMHAKRAVYGPLVSTQGDAR